MPQKRTLGIWSLVLGVISTSGGIGVIIASGSFLSSILGGPGNPESVIGLTILAVVLIQGVLFLISLAGLILGFLGLKREKARGLAVSGIILNALLLSLACGCLSLGLVFLG